MNLITGKHLSRRTLLRGTLALPFLEAMRPALAATKNSAAEAPLRLAFVYVPNGITMNQWTPAATEGRNWELTRILKPLGSFKNQLTPISGLTHNNGRALGDGPGDHARAAAVFLSGVHPKKTGGADIKNGKTIDQIVAGHIGKETRFASLELTTEPGNLAGDCDSGYSCAYTNTVSWRTPTTPNPAEGNPRMLFERLFGSDAGEDAETRERRRRYSGSILDYVREDSQKLMGRLGAHDQRKLDEYLFAVREIEQRVQKSAAQPQVDPGMAQPSDAPAEFSEHVRLMYDMLAVAFQSDLTRVASFMIGREGSSRTYREIGIAEAHHPLSHHQKDPEKIEKITRINTFHVELFRHFLTRLACTAEGDGSVLDNTLIVYGSAISDGNAHWHHDLPVLLAGGAKGKFRMGERFVYPKETPMNNLFVSMLPAFGLPVEKFGDANGELHELAGLSA
jgi:hypothetical protein